MNSNSARRVLRRKYSARTSFRHRLILAVWALASAGCEEEPRQVVRNERAADRTPAVSAQPKKETGPIIGQRTQKVVSAAPELETGKAKVASTKITAKDPITLVGNAYVSIVGRASMLQIEQAVNLFHANNDRYPKDLAEFMAEIIKANGIALPVLPRYQKYGYDEKEHKLIILEYADRK
jgi:hypothetical protein